MGYMVYFRGTIYCMNKLDIFEAHDERILQNLIDYIDDIKTQIDYIY